MCRTQSNSIQLEDFTLKLRLWRLFRRVSDWVFTSTFTVYGSAGIAGYLACVRPRYMSEEFSDSKFGMRITKSKFPMSQKIAIKPH